MVNLYPVRSREVKLLPQEPEMDAASRNEREIVKLTSDIDEPHIWAAWGNDIEKRSYLIAAVRSLAVALSPLHPVWMHFGELTQKGHPRHPSRLSYSWVLRSFNVTKYCSHLGA